MKIKKIISVFLIYIVLLSSIGYEEAFSQPGCSTSPGKTLPATGWFIEHEMDFSQEFCESIKVSVSAESRAGADIIYFRATISLPSANSSLPPISWNREHHTSLSPQKLFIDFGALLI